MIVSLSPVCRGACAGQSAAGDQPVVGGQKGQKGQKTKVKSKQVPPKQVRPGEGK